MTEVRETNHTRVLGSRALARKAALDKAIRVNESVGNLLARARMILADKDFRTLLHDHGVRTVPACLSQVHKGHFGIDASAKSEKERLDEASLEFIVTWKFFFPLLGEHAIEIRLERMWPGFIAQLKDAFIILVTEGPFPNAVSGHVGSRPGPQLSQRGRRRSAVYRKRAKGY